MWLRLGQVDGTFGDIKAQDTGVSGLNGLIKFSGGDRSWGAGASSAQTFTATGYVEIVANGGAWQVFGLSDVDSDVHWTTIDYAIQLSANGSLVVYESGVYRGTFGTYATGDRLRVERLADGQIVYKKNGQTFYASTAPSTAELRVDSSLYTTGATLRDVVLSSNGGDASLVQWVNDVGVVLGSLASGLTMNLADVDGDGRTDVVLTAADGRVWTRTATGVIAGSPNADLLTGTADNDVMQGGQGDDTLESGAGFDRLYGGGGDDLILGGADADLLNGGAGDDLLNGGTGSDTSDYSDATPAVTVDLLAGTATGEGSDILVDIENVIGGAGDDTLIGSTAANVLQGAAGSDTLEAPAPTRWTVAWAPTRSRVARATICCRVAPATTICAAAPARTSAPSSPSSVSLPASP